MTSKFLASLALVACIGASPVPAFAQHTGHQQPPASEAAQIGTIVISGAFARATLPNAPVGGAYLTLTNSGTADDRLISASSPVAGHAELHEMAVENDVMRMRELPDGIPLPASETVVLKPGSLHVMLMDLKQPLVEGETAPVTLTFERAGAVEVELAVTGIAAASPAHDSGMNPDAHGHGGAGHHGNGAAIDQAGLSDLDAIAHMQKAMFDTPDNPLDMGPIVIAGDYAISDWAQGGAGGRALLRKTAKGWGIHLCAGEDLKQASALVTIGVPEAEAQQLAEALAVAESALSADQIALYDAFNGTMMVDEDLIQ